MRLHGLSNQSREFQVRGHLCRSSRTIVPVQVPAEQSFGTGAGTTNVCSSLEYRPELHYRYNPELTDKISPSARNAMIRFRLITSSPTPRRPLPENNLGGSLDPTCPGNAFPIGHFSPRRKQKHATSTPTFNPALSQPPQPQAKAVFAQQKNMGSRCLVDVDDLAEPALLVLAGIHGLHT